VCIVLPIPLHLPPHLYIFWYPFLSPALSLVTLTSTCPFVILEILAHSLVLLLWFPCITGPSVAVYLNLIFLVRLSLLPSRWMQQISLKCQYILCETVWNQLHWCSLALNLQCASVLESESCWSLLLCDMLHDVYFENY